MALLYTATLNPPKVDLFRAWIPTRPWGADAQSVELLGSFRLDDPAGEVGIDSHVLAVGDRILHVPVTYRGAPLAGAEDALIGTTEHSVLGRRWFYDATADPVYVAALATAALTGGHQADLDVDQGDGSTRRREAVTFASGSGEPGTTVPDIEGLTSTDSADETVISTHALRITVVRGLPGEPVTPAADQAVLTATWPGQDTPVVLATVRLT